MDADPQKKNSCAVVYGPVESLPAGGKRAMAFTYGLGLVTSIYGGGLGLTLGDLLIRPHQEFTVPAHVPHPGPNQKGRIHLPEHGGVSFEPGPEEGGIVGEGT